MTTRIALISLFILTTSWELVIANDVSVVGAHFKTPKSFAIALNLPWINMTW